MPEAAIDKHRYTKAAEDHIGTIRQVGLDTLIDAEANSEAVQGRS